LRREGLEGMPHYMGIAVARGTQCVDSLNRAEELSTHRLDVCDP